MQLSEIALGALITIVEPGTTAGICGKVVHVGESAGGIPTVWALQTGGNRALKAPVAEVKPGCAASSSSVSNPTAPPPSPAPAASAVPARS